VASQSRQKRGVGVRHRGRTPPVLRLVLRVLVYIVTTVATALSVWIALLFVGVLFGESTPECVDSDGCGAWGDFLYNWWPGYIVCLLLGAVIAWRVLPIRK
jgi:hypothetical protein